MTFIEAVNKAFNENKTECSVIRQKSDETLYYPVWIHKDGNIVFAWDEFSVKQLNADDWEIAE